MANRRLITQQIDRGAQLQLWEHFIDGQIEFEMIINGVFIMASYNHLSSELLVRNPMKYFNNHSNVNILVGGLGMGFTVKEACSFGEVGEIDVVEIQPAIVNWNREYLNEFNGSCLNDSRVNIVIDDFHNYVTKTDKCYDIISMDIDNGPMMLVKMENKRVYNLDFFRRMKEIMKPQGIFVIWSCNSEPELLEQIGLVFDCCYVEEVMEEHHHQTISYFLYFARLDG